MKAILEFKLPQDKERFEYANNGFNYYMALYVMDEWLRSECKYNDNDSMCKVREKLHEIINENNVKI